MPASRHAQADDPLDEVEVEFIWRSVNDRIRGLGLTWGGEMDFVCECLNNRCTRTLQVPPDAYDELRKLPSHFAVLPGHEHPSAERVVRYGASYRVVDRAARPSPR